MITVEELCKREEFRGITLPDPQREILSGYSGDLLSWVMGRAKADGAWITIMSNVNILAVASLADVSCIILAEGVEPEPDVVKTAEQKGINLIKSQKNGYEIANILGSLI